MKRLLKKQILGTMLIFSIATLTACGQQNSSNTDNTENKAKTEDTENEEITEDSVYTKEEMEAISEGLNNNKERMKITENIARELEEKKDEIISNQDLSLLYDITENKDKLVSEKLEKLNEKTPPFGGENLFVPYDGIGNKNQILALMLYFTNVIPGDESMSERNKEDIMGLWKHNIEQGEKTIEEMHSEYVMLQKVSSDMYKKVNKIIEELIKEKKDSIPKLEAKEKKMVQEILEINKKNITSTDKGIKDLESQKEDILKNEDRDRIYDTLENIENVDKTEYWKLHESIESVPPMSMDLVDQMTMSYKVEGFGIERSRLAKSMESSALISNELYDMSKEGMKKTRTVLEGVGIEEEYNRRHELLKKNAERLTEYNKVLENALEGKNYLIDNIYFYFGEVEEV